MELNITEFFNNGDHWHNSNSIANLGNDAAKITWANSKEQSTEFMFVTEDNRVEFQEYFAGFGAWDEEEINSWNDLELNALVIQFISGSINELDAYQDDNGELDWEAIRIADEAGTLGFILFKTDDNEIYYYIGS